MVRVTCALAVLFLSCQTAPAVLPSPPPAPRNVVLLIGDGMGPAHFAAARLLRGEAFAAGRFPVTGLLATASEDALVTDSAAAATAIATGRRTHNRGVGVAADGTPVETLLERAHARGKATGLLTTAAFWDATPAAFAAHARSRFDGRRIVEQMLTSGVGVIAGAGAEEFGRGELPPLPEVAAAHGRLLVTDPRALEAAPGGRLLVAFPSQPSDAELPAAPLHRLARWALARLAADPDGFVLVVEHEGPDRASHENAVEALEANLRAFDAAVEAVAEVARARGDTLVLVLGDHETGGLRIEAGDGGAPRLHFSSEAHSGTLVPLFASGPGAERFGGLLDVAEVGRRVQALLTARP